VSTFWGRQNVRVIPGALANVVVRVGANPRLAAVVRLKRAALIGFDLRVDPLRIRGRNADADASENPFRHSGLVRKVGSMCRRHRSISKCRCRARRFRASRACDTPPRTLRRSCWDYSGRWKDPPHRLSDRASKLASTWCRRRLIDTRRAARSARTDGQAPRRTRYRVLRIHGDASNLLRVFEPDILPRPACVGRFVNSIAHRRVAANASLTHTRVDHVGIRIGDRERTHVAIGELAVGDRNP